eukprot:SAG31_NODE_7961_length_1554_cov_40.109278_2_plen_234_part_00
MNSDLEALADARRRERQHAEQKRLQRKAARLAKRMGEGAPLTPTISTNSVGSVGAASATAETNQAAASEGLSAEHGSLVKSKAGKRKAKKMAKQAQVKKIKLNAAGRKAAAATKRKQEQRHRKQEQASNNWPDAGASRRKMISKVANVPSAGRKTKKNAGFLKSSNRQARGPVLPKGKLTKAELAMLAAETVQPTSQAKLPIGFVLGYSKTNGGFGSKADTIAREAGKAAGSR